MTREPVDIEIVEVVPKGSPTGREIIPNEIRINGRPVSAPGDFPVIVHEMPISSSDVVRVTLTLFARRVTIATEESE